MGLRAGTRATGSVSAQALGPSAVTSAMTRSTNEIDNDGVASCSSTVTVRDVAGAALVGLPVTFTVSGTGNTVSQPATGITSWTVGGRTIGTTTTCEVKAPAAGITVTGVSPSTGVVGDTLTITGTNFSGTPTVQCGPVGSMVDMGSPTVVSGTSITATIPAGVSGLVDVSVAGVSLGSAVTVTSAVAPNEPVGFTQVFSNPFNAIMPRYTPDQYGFYWFFGNWCLSIVNDGTSPASAPNFMRNTFPGPTGGTVLPGTGAYQSFTRSDAGRWTTNSEVGKRYFLYGAGLPSGYSISNPFVALVTSNDATTIHFLGDEFQGNYPDATGATSSNGWAGGAGYANAYVAGTGFSSGGAKKQLYTRIRFRVSSNWTDNGNTGTKFFFFEQTGGNNHYINLTEGGSVQPAINLVNPVPGTTWNNPIMRNGVAATLSKNVWHDMEILLVANTAGIGNGIGKIWIDGELLLNSSQMGYFNTGHALAWNNFWFEPTFGGGTNPVPHDQWLDIDHWYASVKA
jgi:hypothetical protein